MAAISARSSRAESGDPEHLGVTEFAWSKSMRKGDHRLVHYPRAMFPAEYPDGFGELYDLATDPWEMRNLYFDRDCQDLVRELRAELLEWLITTTRPGTVSGVNSARFGAPELNRQRQQRYQTVVNRDGKINPRRLRHLENKNYL